MNQPTNSQPAQHYREAERILASLPALGLDAESASREIAAALVHAVLSTADPRSVGAGRRRRIRMPAGPPLGGSLTDRWVRGELDRPDS